MVALAFSGPLAAMLVLRQSPGITPLEVLRDADRAWPCPLGVRDHSGPQAQRRGRIRTRPPRPARRPLPGRVRSLGRRPV